MRVDKNALRSTGNPGQVGQLSIQVNPGSLEEGESTEGASSQSGQVVLLGEGCVSSFKRPFPSQCLSIPWGGHVFWPQRLVSGTGNHLSTNKRKQQHSSDTPSQEAQDQG